MSKNSGLEIYDKGADKTPLGSTATQTAFSAMNYILLETASLIVEYAESNMYDFLQGDDILYTFKQP